MKVILRESVVIDYFNCIRAGISPNKAEPILIIYANTKLTSSISR